MEIEAEEGSRDGYYGYSRGMGGGLGDVGFTALELIMGVVFAWVILGFSGVRYVVCNGASRKHSNIQMG